MYVFVTMAFIIISFELEGQDKAFCVVFSFLPITFLDKVACNN